MGRRAITALAAFGAALWLNNTSVFHSGIETPPRLIAHRGVHQQYAEGVDRATACHAASIAAPTHSFISNTIPSMQAAFAAGADVVEIDVHLTPDTRFAVFHDWTVRCQTDGRGVTHDIPMATLKTLDIGYGFTADGQTFPLRGTGVGLMPTLTEVLAANLGGQYLINFKSKRAEEGHALNAVIEDPEARAQVWGVFGGAPPTHAVHQQNADLHGYTRDSLKRCYLRYFVLGWSGHVPDACRGTTLVLPINVAPVAWGWPHRFTDRMARHGTHVILLGPWEGGWFSSGIDDADTLARVPEGFDGFLWTDRIEVIGPLVKAR